MHFLRGDEAAELLVRFFNFDAEECCDDLLVAQQMADCFRLTEDTELHRSEIFFPVCRIHQCRKGR